MKRFDVKISIPAAVCLLAFTLTFISCGKTGEETKAAETLPPIYTGSETAEAATDAETVSVFGKTYPSDTSEISLNKDEITSFDDLLSSLKRFSGLSLIDLNGYELTVGDKKRLTDEFPGAQIRCRAYALLSGEKIYEDETEIDLSGKEIDITALNVALSSLSNISRVYSDTEIPAADKNSLKTAFPGVSFDIPGTVDINGVRVRDDATELDFNGMNTDAAQLSAALKYLPLLQSVSLFDAGLDEDGIAFAGGVNGILDRAERRGLRRAMAFGVDAALLLHPPRIGESTRSGGNSRHEQNSLAEHLLHSNILSCQNSNFHYYSTPLPVLATI